MSQAKAALHKHRKKGLPVLGAAGLSLCLGSGAPAALGVATTDIPACSVTVTEGHTLREEEFTDITLATFHIFDREGPPRLHTRIAGGACGACGAGLYGDGSGTGAGAGGGGGGCGSGFHVRIGACGGGCGGCGGGGGGCGGGGSRHHERPRSVSPPEESKPTKPIIQTVTRPQDRPQISKHQDENAGRSRREEATRATGESRSRRAATTRDENATPQAQPELDGLVINQSAGHQVEPQMATPVSNSAN
jgi:hypothetical protein